MVNNSNLRAFLDDHKVEKGNAYTHTSIYQPTGSFYISPQDIPTFMTLYKSAMERGEDLYITERHTEIGPILIDLDFRFKAPEDANEQTKLDRKYTNDTITNIFRVYADLLSGYVDGLDHFDIYVMEKPKPTFSKGLIKDGIHIVIPGIVTPPMFQRMIREQALPALKKELEGLQLHNKVYEVVDEAVIDKNNWQMLGSKKPHCDRYRVTRIVRYFTDDGQFDDLDVDMNDACYIEDLSIRNKHRATTIKDDRLQEVHAYEDKINAAKLKVHFKNTIVTRTQNTRTNKLSDDEFKQAQELVALLNKERAEAYNDWIRVGWCLRNIDHRLLNNWIEFSKKSPKFRDGDCEKMWNYMRQDGACLGMGTLHLWAKQDNPAEYNKIVDSELRSLIRESYNGSEYDIARVIQRKYNHSFAYDSANKMWFHFYDHRWHLTHEGMALKKMLPTEVVEEYRKATSFYNNLANTIEDVAQKNVLDELVSKLHSIIFKLKTAAFQGKVMTECAMLFNIDKFDEKLDSNCHLVGFNNGVYDLDAMEFRDGRPEDFLSVSTNINYVPLEKHSEHAVDDVQAFFKQVIMNDSVREYVIRLLASFLHGEIREEWFHVWTGSGSNGKSKLIELYQRAFGDYCCTLPISLLTQKRGASSSATPELARARNKRFACLQEPGENERLNTGLMKEMTGGDKLYARALYQQGGEFKPQFKMVLTCNHLPMVPSDDGGTWRRIRVVRFESKFCENPDPTKPNEFPIDKKLSSKFKDWAEIFMSILVEYYKKSITTKFTEPEEVLECTREYQRRNDIVLDFLEASIIKDDNGFLQLSESFNEFKCWLKEEGCTDRSMRKSDFQTYIEGKYGKAKMVNKLKGWSGYRLKTSMVNDEVDDYD
jgi:P4 family phage/plasmid primase-like protien